MIYPYSSPNLGITGVIKALFLSDKKAEEKIKQYFSKLTGKKYILVTNSCRSALYLTYKGLGKTGEVITSPLTCKVAIDPIVETDNKPVFADIRIFDLNINTDDIRNRINASTIAIQAIHLGGTSCNMDAINKIARENNLWVIEDCAQSLGATYNDKQTGAYGDVSCFSLIKNAYGIGGGILATNSVSIYKETQRINQQLTPTPIKLVLFRIIRNILETKRMSRTGCFLFSVLMKLKAGQGSYASVLGQLHKISRVEKKIAAHQIGKYPLLHQKRKMLGKEYYDRLNEEGILKNNGYEKECSSFTKFFIFNPMFDSKKILGILHEHGIEAMHLEQKRGGPYQDRFITIKQAIEEGLVIYVKVHDCLISLPLFEDMKDAHLNMILLTLQNTLHGKKD